MTRFCLQNIIQFISRKLALSVNLGVYRTTNQPWSSLEEGDEGSYPPKWQSFVFGLRNAKTKERVHEGQLPNLFDNRTYNPSSPINCCAPRISPIVQQLWNVAIHVLHNFLILLSTQQLKTWADTSLRPPSSKELHNQRRLISRTRTSSSPTIRSAMPDPRVNLRVMLPISSDPFRTTRSTGSPLTSIPMFRAGGNQPWVRNIFGGTK